MAKYKVNDSNIDLFLWQFVAVTTPLLRLASDFWTLPWTLMHHHDCAPCMPPVMLKVYSESTLLHKPNANACAAFRHSRELTPSVMTWCRYSDLSEYKEKGNTSFGMQQVLATQRSTQSHTTSQPFTARHTAAQLPLTQMSAQYHTAQSSMGSQMHRLRSCKPSNQLQRSSILAESKCHAGPVRWSKVRHILGRSRITKQQSWPAIVWFKCAM